MKRCHGCWNLTQCCTCRRVAISMNVEGAEAYITAAELLSLAVYPDLPFTDYLIEQALPSLLEAAEEITRQAASR